jgi:hypothetical protein
MSEHYPGHNHEHESHVPETRSEKAPERHISHAEEAHERHKQTENLEHARHEVQAEAETAEQIAEKLTNRTQETNQHEEVHA